MSETIKSKRLTAFVFISVGFLIAYITFAQAQGVGSQTDNQVSANGITFPIPELGNCVNKDSCRAYCSQPANITVCVKFAKAHGLMNDEEAAHAEKFAENIKSGGGPGGCHSPDSCEQFCSEIANLEVCTRFAESQGSSGPRVEQGKKLLSFIKSGGKMPGGCNSEESCRAYCGDFGHAEECFEFAKKAGITQVRGEGIGGGRPEFDHGQPTDEQLAKFLELVKSGETPGGCKSKEECESYCEAQGHFEECVAFGVKAGFIKPDEAEKIKATGGRGPGGCHSLESCRAYCNDQTHREECFKFAEDHGFLNQDDSRQAKEGLVKLRAGLEQAPPEISACLKSTLGENIIQDIQSGNLTPGLEISDRVRECFEKFGRDHGSGEFLRDAPPEVIACVKEKLGSSYDDIQSGKVMPTPEMADAVRICFQAREIQKGEFEGPEGEGAPGSEGNEHGGPRGHMGGEFRERFQEFLDSAPQGVQDCLRRELGGDFDKLKSGETGPSADIKNKVQTCFQSFRPAEQSSAGGESGEVNDGEFEGQRSRQFGPGRGIKPGIPGGGFRGSGESEPFGPPSGGSFGGQQGAQQDVVNCVKNAVGSEVFEKIQSGELPKSEIKDKAGDCYRQFQESGNRGGPPGQNYQQFPRDYLPPPGGSYNKQSGPSGDGTYDGTYQASPGGQVQPPLPTGTFTQPPSGGTYPPPSSGGTYTQPPSGGTYSPPSPSGETYSPPPPTSAIPLSKLIGTILAPFADLLAR